MTRLSFTGNSASKRVSEVVLHLLVIIAWVFDFRNFGANEANKLAAARHYFHPDWLANDWYLGLETARYEVFNLIMGPLVSYLGFTPAAILGRLLCYTALAAAFSSLGKSLRLPWYATALVLVLFMPGQSFVAGEWMAGGVEAKSLAYAALLLAVSTYSRSTLSIGAAWLGGAISLHPLIGAYGGLCLAGATAVTCRWRHERLLTMLPRQWPILLTGLPGIAAILGELQSSTHADPHYATWIYVFFRNPHHLLPEAWDVPPWKWTAILIAAASSAVFMVAAPRVGRIRFVAAFVLFALLIFVVGIVSWLVNAPLLLKYYPFRLADTFVPLWFLTFSVWLFVRRKGIKRVLARWSAMVPVGPLAAALLTLAAIFLVRSAVVAVREGYTRFGSFYNATGLGFEAPPMLAWIANNTDRNAVLLVPATESSTYLHAERAVVVTFKHAPHSDSGIVQWFERIKDINGGETPRSRGFMAISELDQSYSRLQESDVMRLAKKYAATHMLAGLEMKYPFDRLHEIDGWVLYRLPIYESP